MNYKHYFLLISLLTSTAPGIAQSKFEGLYGQVAIGYETINPSASNTPITIRSASGATTVIPFTTSMSSASGVTGNVALGYTAAISNNFALAVGAEYYPINTQSGSYSSTKQGRTSSGTYQIQNAYNFYLAPGMNVGADGLAYFKLGYTGASLYSYQDGSETQGLSGYSLGLGYKQLFADSWYGFGEMNYLSYGNVTDSQTSQSANRTVSVSTGWSSKVYNFLVGVGYKF